MQHFPSDLLSRSNLVDCIPSRNCSWFRTPFCQPGIPFVFAIDIHKYQGFSTPWNIERIKTLKVSTQDMLQVQTTYGVKDLYIYITIIRKSPEFRNQISNLLIECNWGHDFHHGMVQFTCLHLLDVHPT